MIAVTAQPEDVPLGGMVSIRVKSTPGTRVCIEARVQDDHPRHRTTFASKGIFETPRDGTIDTAITPSKGGSYEGVVPMGLFVFMQPVPGSRTGARFFKTDTSTPSTVHITATLITMGDDEPSSTSTSCASCTIRRHHRPDPNRWDRIQVDMTPAFRGILYTPRNATPGSLRAVAQFGGSGGGIMEHWSAHLASSLGVGFCVLAVGYFNMEGLPDVLTEVDLSQFQHAIDWLLEQPAVDASLGVATLGNSFGAQLMLDWATEEPRVTAAVSIVGSTVRSSPGADWHFPYHGTARPAVPWQLQSAAMITLPDGSTALASTPGVAAAALPILYTRQAEDDEVARVRRNAQLELERINGPILFVSGTEDASWPSSSFGELGMRRLRQHGHRFAFTSKHVSYEGAGHVMEPPYEMFCPFNYHGAYGTNLHWGGSMYEHHRAQLLFWEEVVYFLQQTRKGRNGNSAKL